MDASHSSSYDGIRYRAYLNQGTPVLMESGQAERRTGSDRYLEGHLPRGLQLCGPQRVDADVVHGPDAGVGGVMCRQVDPVVRREEGGRPCQPGRRDSKLPRVVSTTPSHQPSHKLRGRPALEPAPSSLSAALSGSG